MTPLQISILIHYYGCASDFRDGDFDAPAVREAINMFKDEMGLLEERTEREIGSAFYGLTERGHVYVEALKKVPLPVQKWTLPEAA